MGMFGSVGKFFGDLKTPGADGLTVSDKLAYLASGFGDPEDFARGTSMIGAKRAAYQKKAATDAFEQTLAQKLGPQYQNGPDPTVNVPRVPGVGSGGFMSPDTLPQPQPAPEGAISEGLPGQGVNFDPHTFGSAAQSAPTPYHYEPPVKVSDGLNANSPELPALVMQAQKAGYSMDDILKVMQMQQPDVRFDRGFGYNGKTGAAQGGFHPDMDKGQEPVFDQNGRIVGVRNMDGSVQAAADMAGAVSGAQEHAKANYDLVPVPQSDGSSRMMPRSQALGALGGGGIGAAPGGPGLGVSQSPAQAAAAKIEAEAGANARIAAPAQLAGANQAVSTIDQLMADPGLHDRTGLMGRLPALPGTHGVAIDAMHDQLKGKVFLQAYGELKGAGAITEIEGQKAEQAIARLNRAQSYPDYMSALKDLRSVVTSGIDRTKQRAGGGSPNAPSAAPPAPPAGHRQPNAVYQTPRGPMKWTGTGWLPQ